MTPAPRPSALRNGRLVALFVPATRPERFAKAAAAGADAIIIDLEDAVAHADKATARAAVASALPATGPVLLRINGAATSWHEDDLDLARSLPLAGVVLAKAESAAEVARVAGRLGSMPVVPLIESALGLAQARAIACVPQVARLAFGSIDFAADLGCAHTRNALLAARSELVLASRLAGLDGPVDGVTTALSDGALATDDAAYAAEIGFAGKLLIHPSQIAPVMAGFAPSAEEIAWARRIVAALAEGGAVVTVDGAMVDAPVRLRAERILSRA
ncbi:MULTISPECIES: CoA ester lyase [unclassified Xanthobacter]|uniref:HpcH/HpaI aldolase/citrate lyase family protein n=1 Tax=unclassified Xanthobacter TaxID=2623496 RepID=UPI001F161487|nr:MULTISPECIES: CoA ester lyase [unclassified Xanthobacter]